MVPPTPSLGGLCPPPARPPAPPPMQLRTFLFFYVFRNAKITFNITFLSFWIITVCQVAMVMWRGCVSFQWLQLNCSWCHRNSRHKSVVVNDFSVGRKNLVFLQLSGAYTPYKRWSKYTIKNRGEGFCRNLGGCVNYLCTPPPLSFCNKFPLQN